MADEEISDELLALFKRKDQQGNKKLRQKMNEDEALMEDGQTIMEEEGPDAFFEWMEQGESEEPAAMDRITNDTSFIKNVSDSFADYLADQAEEGDLEQDDINIYLDDIHTNWSELYDIIERNHDVRKLMLELGKERSKSRSRSKKSRSRSKKSRSRSKKSRSRSKKSRSRSRSKKSRSRSKKSRSRSRSRSKKSRSRSRSKKIRSRSKKSRSRSKKSKSRSKTGGRRETRRSNRHRQHGGSFNLSILREFTQPYVILIKDHIIVRSIRNKAISVENLLNGEILLHIEREEQNNNQSIAAVDVNIQDGLFVLGENDGTITMWNYRNGGNRYPQTLWKPPTNNSEETHPVKNVAICGDLIVSLSIENNRSLIFKLFDLRKNGLFETVTINDERFHRRNIQNSRLHFPNEDTIILQTDNVTIVYSNRDKSIKHSMLSVGKKNAIPLPSDVVRKIANYAFPSSNVTRTEPLVSLKEIMNGNEDNEDNEYKEDEEDEGDNEVNVWNPKIRTYNSEPHDEDDTRQNTKKSKI
jgi:hypothetical protein